MSYDRPVLFVSHDASRTGAPIDLLRFLRWMKRNVPKHSFAVLLKDGGPLTGDFQTLCPVYHWPAVPSGPFSCVFANTLAVLDVVYQLPPPQCPIIVYARELEYVIKKMCDRDLLLRDPADLYLADSYAVKAHLERAYHIAPEKVQCVYESVPLAAYTDEEKKIWRASVRDEVSIPADAFIVASCGTISWRKGADLFVQVARLAQQTAPPSVHFVWIGGSRDEDTMEQLRHDIRKFNLEAAVHFIGPRAHPRDYMAASDVYFVASREEPLSVAMLEAASAGLPVVCFQGAGGPEEFVERDAGIIVPYGDIYAAAQAVRRLYQSPHERQRRGETAKQKIARRHNLHDTAPRIVAIINRSIQMKERQETGRPVASQR